ncbi:MAG: heme A synthase [Cyclobacteriaceae bacterium]
MLGFFMTYSKALLYTLLSVYLLIFVGAFVRSTGAGMGCPDWPKCFDSWIPPTNSADLPANYQDVLKEKRVKKSLRVSKTLAALGFTQLSNKVKSHSVGDERVEEFRVTKAWIEYVNRLVGVIVGLLVFLAMVLSFKFFKTDKKTVFLNVGVFVLVGIQGWLGSLVVATNLFPGMITIHMFIALVIALLLIYLYYESITDKEKKIAVDTTNKKVRLYLIASIVLLFIQVLLGTNVREQIDVIAKSVLANARNQWIAELDIVFYIHRSFSVVIVILQVLILRAIKKEKKFTLFYRIILIAIMVEIAVGAYMAYFSIPAFLQPIHLLVGLVLVGAQYWVFLNSRSKFVSQLESPQR